MNGYEDESVRRIPWVEEDEPDWDWRGRRRDYEPHRGGTVQTCGILSVVCVPLALFCALFMVAGLVLGVLALVWGSADIRAINEDRMDPEGLSATHTGWVCGLIGVILNVLVVGTGIALVAFLIASGNLK